MIDERSGELYILRILDYYFLLVFLNLFVRHWNKGKKEKKKKIFPKSRGRSGAERREYICISIYRYLHQWDNYVFFPCGLYFIIRWGVGRNWLERRRDALDHFLRNLPSSFRLQFFLSTRRVFHLPWTTLRRRYPLHNRRERGIVDLE